MMTGRPLSPVLLALSMAAAVSLGITRFAYGMLLPIMRDDLGWSYTLAGAMNTANALGYLVGALSAPALLRRWGAATAVLVWPVRALNEVQAGTQDSARSALPWQRCLPMLAGPGGSAGLSLGLMASAGVLWLGSALALMQKPLGR